MCGIAGIISHKQDKLQDVQRMISCLSHRGPDGEATWQNEASLVALGHRRLSIIDLSPAAAQPMHYLGRYTIVHNGEIYNYKELRETLSKKGYRFHSQSDTEVILAAYDNWRHECLQYFDGMFAFALWDEQEQTLFAARDRFGEKPFYYVRNDEGFFFASEIRAFRSIGIREKYNGNLLLQYLANGFVQDAMDPAATFDTGTSKLPARHYLYYRPQSGELQLAPYFDIDKTINETTIEDATRSFSDLFFASVEKRLRSDVETGTSLSGGLDSSSVVAAIHRLKQTGMVQKAFTASFPGFEKDEAGLAGKVAAAFGLQHHVVQLTAGDIVADLEKFLSQHDEPVSSSSVYAQYKVYELAKQQGIKVLLDGQGADEVLAGYSRYIHWYLQELYAGKRKDLLRREIDAFSSNGVKVPFNFKNILAALLPAAAALRLQQRAIKQQKDLPFVSRDFAREHLDKNSIYKPVVRTLNDILYFDVFGGPLEELLRYADRNAMAHGIEVRLPFLNHELVQFVFSLPSSFKLHNGYTKHLLRAAMDGMLPKEIAWRKDKIGFEPPQRQWMQHPALQEQVRAAKERLVKEKVLDPAVLTQPIVPKDAFEAGNYDWRFLSAARLL